MAGRTTYWNSDTDENNLRGAAAVLARGGTVAFATETVYGLGADARSTDAVARIFAAKGRPSDNPLIVHIAEANDAAELAAKIGGVERRLMDAFWPGPLTLVLPAKAGAVSPLVTAGLDTVAVRVPAHPAARKLIRLAGCPVAAPSANRSGRPSPTEARHVAEDLDGQIDGLLDGGPTRFGLESTVVRVVDGTVHILRPGGVTREMLGEALGGAAVIAPAPSEGRARPDPPGSGSQRNESIGHGGNPRQSESIGHGGNPRQSESTGHEGSPQRNGPIGHEGNPRQSESIGHGGKAEAEATPRSPGVKYAHYAPRGEMLLISGDADRLRDAVQRAADEARARGRRVGVLACTEHALFYRADEVMDLGPGSEPERAASRLYALLRLCDRRGLDFIVAESYPERGAGEALMNRLRKAAGGNEERI